MLLKRIGFFVMLVIFFSFNTKCKKDNCYICTLRDPQSPNGNYLHKDFTCSQRKVDTYISKGYSCTLQ
jgi:hypothetical protein